MSEKAKIPSELVEKKETKVDILNDIYSFLDERIETDSYFEFGTSKKEILKKWFGENKINLDDNGLIDKQVKELEKGLSALNLSQVEKDKSVTVLLNELRNDIKNSFYLESDKLDDNYVNRKLDFLFNNGLDMIDERMVSQKELEFEKKKLEEKKRSKIKQEKLEEIRINKLKTEELENKKIEEQRIEEQILEEQRIENRKTKEELAKEKADKEMSQAIIDVDKKDEDLDDNMVKNIKEKQIEEKPLKEKGDKAMDKAMDKEMEQAIKDVDVEEEITDVKPYESIVDYLDSEGIDSSFEDRKILAEKKGIYNYIGSTKQNIKLLELMLNKNGYEKDDNLLESLDVIDYD